MKRRVVLVLGMALLASACVGTRPYPGFCPASGAGAGPTNTAPDPTRSEPAEAFALSGGPARDKLAILVLSGGGSWGAYGAGFLGGWSERAVQLGYERPRFDMVTGISTGAIIAPFALLGPQWDATLATAYRGVRKADIFEARSLLGLPFWNSLTDPAPMEKRLGAALNDRAVAELAQAAEARRSVWIGATNYDTGRFTRFNLTDIARRLPPREAHDAIVQRVMAAAAIPFFFPPRFIDGCMYMDGGVRENLFLSDVGDEIDAEIGGWRAWGLAKVEIYAIVNGPIAAPPREAQNTLFDVATRSFELASDQIQLVSLRRDYDFARRSDYTFHWTSADDLISKSGDPGKCRPPETAADQFDLEFTLCLFEAGRAKARLAAEPWRTDRP